MLARTAAPASRTLRFHRVTGRRGAARTLAGAALRSGAADRASPNSGSGKGWFMGSASLAGGAGPTGAGDPHDGLGLLAEAQFRDVDQAVDNVVAAQEPVVDQLRLILWADQEQRRRLAGAEVCRELDIGLQAVIEDAQRLPAWAVPGVDRFDLVAQIPVVDARLAEGRLHGRSTGGLLLAHLLLRIIPGDDAGVGVTLAADGLQEVGPLVRGQDDVGPQIAADRLDDHDHLLRRADALDSLAQHPAHGVAGGFGDQLLPRPQRDGGEEAGTGVDGVEPARLVVVIERRIDIGAGGRPRARRAVGPLNGADRPARPARMSPPVRRAWNQRGRAHGSRG